MKAILFTLAMLLTVNVHAGVATKNGKSKVLSQFKVSKPKRKDARSKEYQVTMTPKKENPPFVSVYYIRIYDGFTRGTIMVQYDQAEVYKRQPRHRAKPYMFAVQTGTHKVANRPTNQIGLVAIVLDQEGAMVYMLASDRKYLNPLLFGPLPDTEFKMSTLKAKAKADVATTITLLTKVAVEHARDVAASKAHYDTAIAEAKRVNRPLQLVQDPSGYNRYQLAQCQAKLAFLRGLLIH